MPLPKNVGWIRTLRGKNNDSRSVHAGDDANLDAVTRCESRTLHQEPRHLTRSLGAKALLDEIRKALLLHHPPLRGHQGFHRLGIYPALGSDLVRERNITKYCLTGDLGCVLIKICREPSGTWPKRTAGGDSSTPGRTISCSRVWHPTRARRGRVMRRRGFILGV